MEFEIKVCSMCGFRVNPVIGMVPYPDPKDWEYCPLDGSKLEHRKIEAEGVIDLEMKIKGVRGDDKS